VRREVSPRPSGVRSAANPAGSECDESKRAAIARRECGCGDASGDGVLRGCMAGLAAAAAAAMTQR
jgi:hypothetical protein